jgi:hypothetical protein
MRPASGLESNDQAIAEVLTLIPVDASSEMPGVANPIHEIQTRGVLRRRTDAAFTSGGEAVPGRLAPCAESLTATFARADLPWAISCGDRIRRGGDEAVYEVKEIIPDGVRDITAVVSAIQMLA